MDYGEKALKLHKKFQGKLETVSKTPIKTREDLSIVYTPGVGAVSQYIAKNPILGNGFISNQFEKAIFLQIK